jgi:hypothetical protein
MQEYEVDDDRVRWNVSPNVRCMRDENGAVLLDVRKGLCYGLNAVAARVWVIIESSEGGITVTGVVDALETLFKVPRRRLRSDVAECVEQLREMDVIFAAKTTAGGM